MSVEAAILVAKTVVVSAGATTGVLAIYAAAEMLVGRSDRERRENKREAVIAAANSPQAKAREQAEERKRAARAKENDANIIEIEKLSAQLNALGGRSSPAKNLVRPMRHRQRFSAAIACRR